MDGFEGRGKKKISRLESQKIDRQTKGQTPLRVVSTSVSPQSENTNWNDSIAPLETPLEINGISFGNNSLGLGIIREKG